MIDATVTKSPTLSSMIMRKHITALTFAGALVSTMEAKASEGRNAAAELIEASLVDDMGAAERIEAADVLRTMSQEVAAASCFLYSGIDASESARMMVEGRDKFDLNLDALFFGNAAMNIIGAETRRKTIVLLEEVKQTWQPMSDAVDTLVTNPTDSAAIKVIKTNNIALFELTNVLVSEISGQYSNPAELMQVDAILLDIVGRQGMLTQKISKNACKVWNGEEIARSSEALTGAMQMFETSLKALLNGMPEAGIVSAPTPEIAAVLSGVIKDWDTTRPLVDDLLSKGTLGDAEQISLFRAMNDKMYRLEALAHDYAIYSKHQYD